MLIARLARNTPGRPEADLAVVTIVPKLPRRGQPAGTRFEAQVVIDGQGRDERDEQHVHVPEWNSQRPAVDLLAHVLNLARAQRDIADVGETYAWVLGRTMAEFALQALDYAIERGYLQPDVYQAAALDQLRTELAEQSEAA